jgi:hypothetical protein
LNSGTQTLTPEESLDPTWQDSIFRQREELARMLREPLTLLARKCIPVWSNQDLLNSVLIEGFSGIPYCTSLYVMGIDGVQTSDNVSDIGLMPGHYQHKHAEHP